MSILVECKMLFYKAHLIQDRMKKLTEAEIEIGLSYSRSFKKQMF